MDVSEIRTSFALSETLPEKIKRFRDNRIAKIVAGETPIPMINAPKFIVHICPLVSFSTALTIDISDLDNNTRNVLPIGTGCTYRLNMDGILKFNPYTNEKGSISYCQIYRSGIFESVWSNFTDKNGLKYYIASTYFEEKIMDGVKRYLAALEQLEISTPFLTMTCLTGVSGFIMGSRNNYNAVPIDRDILFPPEILMEEYPIDTAKVLRPVFDSIWNASGYLQSPNYGENGDWKPR